ILAFVYGKNRDTGRPLLSSREDSVQLDGGTIRCHVIEVLEVRRRWTVFLSSEPTGAGILGLELDDFDARDEKRELRGFGTTDEDGTDHVYQGQSFEALRASVFER